MINEKSSKYGNKGKNEKEKLKPSIGNQLQRRECKE
jgi:hypothetical protein